MLKTIIFKVTQFLGIFKRSKCLLRTTYTYLINKLVLNYINIYVYTLYIKKLFYVSFKLVNS